MRKAYVIAYTALKTGKTWESEGKFLHASTVEYYIASMSLENARMGVVASLKAVEVADDAVLDEALLTKDDAILSDFEIRRPSRAPYVYKPVEILDSKRSVGSDAPR